MTFSDMKPFIRLSENLKFPKNEKKFGFTVFCEYTFLERQREKVVGVKKIPLYKFNYDEVKNLILAYKANQDQEQNDGSEHIIKIIGFTCEKTERWIIMEIAECNLEEYLKYPDSNFSASKQKLGTKEILFGIIKGLKHLHSKKITHHDIKPPNILIRNGKPSRAVICDFGQSIQTEDSTFALTKNVGTRVSL